MKTIVFDKRRSLKLKLLSATIRHPNSIDFKLTNILLNYVNYIIQNINYTCNYTHLQTLKHYKRKKYINTTLMLVNFFVK